MIRSYSFQNSRAFPMACATFETTAQKTLGTLARSAIYDSFSWNASLRCVRPYVRPSVRVSWFENANNSKTAGTRRTKFGTQVGWRGPVIVLKFQHTATDGGPSARARVRH